ncbi:MAG: low molecular weight protein-tyrosine-phosphatase [Thiotrichales bacterium]
MAFFGKKKKSAAAGYEPQLDGCKVKVLFVCMGNICRSPTAQGVFQRLIAEKGLDDTICIDSAGTISYHVGRPPDERAQQAATERGYDLSEYRARRVTAEDAERFDYIVVMDETNMMDVRSEFPKDAWPRVKLFLDYSPGGRRGQEVPDPYSGGSADFELVLDLVEKAADGLLRQIGRDFNLPV